MPCSSDVVQKYHKHKSGTEASPRSGYQLDPSKTNKDTEVYGIDREDQRRSILGNNSGWLSCALRALSLQINQHETFSHAAVKGPHS